MDLIFASQNQSKVTELKTILPNQIQVKSLLDIGFIDDIEEHAQTIEGNSLIKAKYIYERFKVNCLSDDTGLEVEALDGQRGVLSARFAGKEASSTDNIDKLLFLLRGHKNRKARFKTVMTLILNGEVHQFEGLVFGSISYKEIGGNGFGYDSIFIPDGRSLSFAQMKAIEKNKISHRYLALNKVCDFISRIA